VHIVKGPDLTTCHLRVSHVAHELGNIAIRSNHFLWPLRASPARDEIILGIPMGPVGIPMGMGIARLVSLEWEWEREWLDGNGWE